MAKNTVNVKMTADVGQYDANIAKARRTLEGFKQDNLSMGGVMKQLSTNLVGTASRFLGVTAAIGALGSAIRDNIATARGFERSMSQLSSLTGMTGKDLETLKDYAIELGSSTTLSASQVADAFKLIGSQQPQLLSSASALKEVTEYAIRLSEAAGIDLATASQTLSASINQMGGDSNNAARYVNVLAAASQQGAGDIAWLGESITKAATAAKAVGTDYEELVANLEQLAKAGFDASTAGTALRSIIMNLEKQSNANFKPSVVGLTEAFGNLAKAQLDITGYQEIAGKMFATQAKVLAEAADASREMTAAITGTSTAEQQASTNTANLDGSLKSLASAWEGLNLHINSSNGLLKSAVDWLKDVVTWADRAFTSAGKVQARLAELNGGGNGEPTKVDSQIASITAAGDSRVAQMNAYNAVRYGYEGRVNELRTMIDNGGKMPGAGSGESRSVRWLEQELAATEKMRDEFMARAAKILFPTEGSTTAAPSPVDTVIEEAAKTTKTTKTAKEEYVPLAGSIDAQVAKVKELQDAFNAAGSDGIRMGLLPQLKEAEQTLERMKNQSSMWLDPSSISLPSVGLPEIKIPEIDDSQLEKQRAMIKIAEQNAEAWTSAANAIGSVGSALQAIDDPAVKVAGLVAQAIATIAQTFAASLKGTFTPWDWIAGAAAGTATMISTIAAIKQATAGSYANGGVIGGTHFSGDMQLARVNAGELILNQAQQGVIASQLQQGNMFNNMNLTAVVSGEQLRLVIRNYNNRRKSSGEYVTIK